MNTRSIIFAIAAVCALAAVSNAHTDEAIESYAEATEFVSSFEKSGKGDSACLKVANDAVQTIKKECAAQQKVVNTAAKANKACCNNGRKAVCRSKAQVNTAQSQVDKCNKELTTLQQKKITFPAVSLSSLNGKCGYFYSAQVYRSARKKADNKKTACTKLSGALKDSKKTLRREVRAAALSRTTCNQNYKRRLNTAFKASKKVCSSKANAKAFLRAAHMKCVLAGTKISKCKIGKAPVVSKTNQSGLTCAAINEKTTCQSGPASIYNSVPNGCSYDGKKGLIADASHCGKNIALYVMKNGGANSQYWKQVSQGANAGYECPTGWKWATGQEYLNKVSGHCRMNNGSSRHRDPWRGGYDAANSKCGTSGYNFSNSGGANPGYYFIFRDSYKTTWYQHPGHRLGYVNKGGFNYKATNVARIAGIACVRN